MKRVNPYIGPRAFRSGEVLPNRERTTARLANQLIAERVVLLYAPSGSGKTSLIQTSLTDLLRERGFDSTKALRVNFPLPPELKVDNRYVVGLALDLLGVDAGGPGMLAHLRLDEVLAQLPQQDGRRRVLIIDQMEEVLTLDRTDIPVKVDFFRQLGEALEDRSLWALLAVREDHLGQLDRYLRYLPNHLRSRCRLDFLQEHDAMAAVQKPAHSQGVAFTDEAAHALIARLAVAGYVEPFRLQVACRQLWKDWRNRRGDNFQVVALRDVEEFDLDLDRALSRYYAQSMAELSKHFEVDQRTVRDWFEEALITPQRLRNQTTIGPFADGRDPAVLARLVDMYLIRSDRRAGTDWYELAHDRLVGAVLEDNQGWQLRTLPGWQVAAYEWKRKGRARSFLYPASKLNLAPPPSTEGLLDHERAYLEESHRESRFAGSVREPHSVEISLEDVLTLNGVDVDTGRYLFPPLPVRDLAEAARGTDLTSPYLRAMKRRHSADEAHLGVSFIDNPNDLEQAGWGVLLAKDTHPAVVEALRPLLTLRQKQAGSRYAEFEVRAGDTADDFLTRNGMSPGPADPRKIPYYLMIVGPPQSISFSFQYQMDVEYAVGRLDFDTPAEYAAYATAVVSAEERDRRPLAIHLFGTRNPGDLATALSASRLVEPLAKELADLAPGIEVGTDVGPMATKNRLTALLADGPPVLFTATHGLGRDAGPARDIQGAIVCQEWPGPMAGSVPLLPGQYFSAADVSGPLAPRVVMSFACYSAGTPGDAFVARLPQRLLAAGVLGFVGHVDKAWSYSFLWKGVDPQITAMVDSILSLHKGHRLGYAMEAVNSRWATIATHLITTLDEMRVDGRIVDDTSLAWLWTASNDARTYVVLGDPAVRAW